MVKGNKETPLKPGMLFFLAVAMLCAGWLMKPFPVFIFVALAPLFAIIDHAKGEDHLWNRIELVLLALVVGLLAAHFFDMRTTVVCLIQAIVISFAFMGSSFVHQRLSLGKISIVFFWLAAEYLLLLLPWRDRMAYLGDALALQPNWLHWTLYTGYSGLSFWILASNLFAYFSFFRMGKINWIWLTASVFLISGPILFSYFTDGALISRSDMITLYSKTPGLAEDFISRGEVIHKSAAGMAFVLLVAAFFRNKKQTG